MGNIENILDFGTGTGIIAIFLQLFQINNPKFRANIFASDISDEAIKCAKLNEKRNNINKKITFIESNIFNLFSKKLYNSFNIIIFNPPYLPSSKYIKKENKKLVDLSWDGGNQGFEILTEFLKKAKQFLNLEKKHSIYCITSSRTNLTDLDKKIKDLGYKNEILYKKHIFFEDIILNRLKYRPY